MERFRIALSLARNGEIPQRGNRLARNGRNKKLRKIALAEFNL
jgi:hypothetical protein